MTVTTMKDCRDVAPWLAALAEDDAPPPDPQVAAHVEHCPSCQRSLRLQREMHGLLRARAATLQVRTVEAGNGPTYLASVPGQTSDTTVVLNVLLRR